MAGRHMSNAPLSRHEAAGEQSWRGSRQDVIAHDDVPIYADIKGDPGLAITSGPSSFSNGQEEPTEEELRTLVRVADKLPWSAWLVAVIELCERFAYYGLSGPFQNYIQNPYHGGKLPGAIGQ